MKQNVLKSILNNNRAKGGIAALALAVIIGGAALISEPSEVAELPSFTEPIMEATLQEEETPLAAAPKVTKKTTKKTSKKTVKIAKAAKKTYTNKLPATTKTTTKNSTATDKANNTITNTKVETQVVTAVTEKYTKKKKTKAVTTTTTTTVTTTVTTKALATPTPAPTEQKAAASSTTTAAYVTTASKLAPKMNQNVLNAYETLGFKITVSPSVNYSGYYNTKDRMITLNARQLEIFPDTVYHELGHFVAFIAGNVDTKADFGAIYAAEKDKMTGVNKAYNSQNASEYFAESVKEYIVNPGALKSSRPKTYAAVESAIGKVTDSRVASAKKVYASIWK